ncbi:hypothetical protein [Cohnella silvisoli]|uniref:Uncharacterized protein n=1 Tax=Cohnella silvisoli TaxID=2873699 RepID=A0ABV1L380_9BACL|nr:hypothetical protein [Cohnella silvisoli]MCD9026030.1 hypothetical protein [Cohnella silvisoli]
MHRVVIYLKSGNVVEIETNEFEYRKGITGKLEEISWMNHEGKKTLNYIDVDQIEAITGMELNDDPEAGGL